MCLLRFVLQLARCLKTATPKHVGDNINVNVVGCKDTVVNISPDMYESVRPRKFVKGGIDEDS